MSSKIKEILNTGKYDHPSYVKETLYEVLTGSHAYGTNTEESDFDIYSLLYRNYYVPTLVLPALDGMLRYSAIKKCLLTRYLRLHLIVI